MQKDLYSSSSSLAAQEKYRRYYSIDCIDDVILHLLLIELVDT